MNKIRKSVPRKYSTFLIGKRKIHLNRKQINNIYFQLSKVIPFGRMK